VHAITSLRLSVSSVRLAQFVLFVGKLFNFLVCGISAHSGSKELVSAILDHPFESQKSLIRSRWNGRDNSSHVTIQSSQPTQSNHSIYIPSPYLQQFPFPIQLTELKCPPSTPLEPPPPIDDDRATLLLQADIPIIVCNPLTTPLHTLPPLLTYITNPHTIIIITTPPHPHLINPITTLFPHPRPTVLFIDPHRALHALDTLAATPTPASLEQYQHDFLASQISSLTTTLSRFLDSSHSSLRTQSAVARTHSAFCACTTALAQTSHALLTLRERVSNLRGRVAEARALAPHEVLIANDAAGDIVQHALRRAKQDLKPVLTRLTWWRLVWHVDEIGEIVSDAVQRAYCQDLEQHVSPFSSFSLVIDLTP
jgi:hypothetical protein